MKVKDGYILKKVAGENIVIATGEARLSFNGIITFNEVGAEVFTRLDGTKTITQIVQEIASLYNAPKDVIEKDINNLIEKMRNHGLLEE
ncbi:MAG: PqqD family protein [Oscillospiraceae bacterium]|nr:PqqD family protein [Oscillospiraceae bacterium]